MARASLESAFLSCLFGSERGVQVGQLHFDFLSCLFGSELSHVLQL